MRAFVVLGFFHIGLGKRLQKDLFCVEWDVKPQLIVINAAHTHTHPFNGPFFRDYPGEPVPERQNQSGFY